jgi:hypothetical protein
MPYLRLHYLYRDHANYKQHGSATFSNPNHLPPEEVETTLRKHMLDETWFLHYQWNLPDLHFEKTDWENDHPYHELAGLENTDHPTEPPLSTIEEFLDLVKKSSYTS